MDECGGLQGMTCTLGNHDLLCRCPELFVDDWQQVLHPLFWRDGVVQHQREFGWWGVFMHRHQFRVER
jgi:hypothetical protein